MPEQNSADQRSPELLAANRPMARAIGLARARAARSQEKFAAALRAIGVPAARNQVSAWELGADPAAVSDVKNIAIVPAHVLVGASKVAGLTVGELLTMAGVEGQDPYQDQLTDLRRQLADLARVRRRQEMIEEALNELRSYRGLPPLPVIEEGVGD